MTNRLNRKLKLLFARLRGHLETQSVMDGVAQAQQQWHFGPSGSPYPSDDLLHAANHFRKAGDPRSELLQWHADMMDRLKDDDPHYQHVGDTRSSRSLAAGSVPLPDGSSLFVQSHGHYEFPGVHAVSVHWTPKDGSNSYAGHFHPDEARGLADRFGEADQQVGQAFHKVLDQGEDRADADQFRPEKFSKQSEAGFHQQIAADPTDHFHSLVYADWLQDQGKEQHAKLIREHLTRHGSPEVSPQVPFGLGSGSGAGVIEHHHNGQPTGYYQVGLQHEIPREGGGSLYLRWLSPVVAPKAAMEMVNGLGKEGTAARVPSEVYKQGLVRAKNSRQAQSQKFTAYRSPSPEGMIVRNTYYEPGSFVPDLQKEQFAADGQQKPKRKSKLKQKLIRLRGVWNNWDQSGGEDPDASNVGGEGV